MSKQWYDFPVTQAHGNGESGEDLGTPDHTPLFFPFDGKVIDASYQTYGGQVVVQANPQGPHASPVMEYFIHMDNIDVHPGDTIKAGQVVGTSGGGVGDMVLHNGQVVAAQSQDWFVVGGEQASTGPHTEFGMFVGNGMSDFNSDWHNPARQIDPSGTVQTLTEGTAPNIAQILQIAQQAEDSTVASVTNNAVANAVKSVLPTWAPQAGMFLLGGAIMVVGIIVFIKPSVPGI